MTVADRTDAWIRRFHPGTGTAPRLVCFPHAGGSATFYFPLSRALAPTVEVLAIQYPGRQDRRGEPCIDSIDGLADELVDALRPLTDRPMVLFGHSMGAVVGYEVARRLQRDGKTPLGLFASARVTPSAPCDDSVHLRDDDGLVAALAELNGTESAVLADEELLRAILPAIRADYQAVETYRHRGDDCLTCPISVLVGEDDPMTALPDARAWAAHTCADFAFETFPGGHFYLAEQLGPVLRTIVRQTDQWTRRAQQATIVQEGVAGGPAGPDPPGVHRGRGVS